MAFSFLRGLYFCLLITNVIDTRFLDYFLLELPTFVFLSIHDHHLCVVGRVAQQQTKQEKRFVVSDFKCSSTQSRTIPIGEVNYLGWGGVIIGNLIMYSLFALFIILFEVYSDNDAKPQTECSGNVK